jgi:molybdenum cofactor cytidylyltransferase
MTISAVVAAAGLSRRMGTPKMLLPWGNTSVLGKVVETVHAGGAEEIIVVGREALREEIARLTESFPVRGMFVDEKMPGDMLTSIQLGLAQAKGRAALVCPGDQPQGEVSVVREIVEAWKKARYAIVIPSFQKKRGHPWLLDACLWQDFLTVQSPLTPRDFLNRHKNKIFYVEMNRPSILLDLDTPADYEKWKP